MLYCFEREWLLLALVTRAEATNWSTAQTPDRDVCMYVCMSEVCGEQSVSVLF